MASKSNKQRDFIMITRKLLRDQSFRGLSGNAKTLYIYLRAKFNYKTWDIVTLTYKEMEDVMSAKAMSRAYKELLTEGFIEKTKQGGLFGGVTQYKFIGEHKEYYNKKGKIT